MTVQPPAKSSSCEQDYEFCSPDLPPLPPSPQPNDFQITIFAPENFNFQPKCVFLQTPRNILENVRLAFRRSKISKKKGQQW